MNTDCHIIVIDDHEIIATGCQGEFAKAGLPWSVIWARGLSDIDWPEGRTLAVLDLRLNDGSRPAEIIAETAVTEITERGATRMDDQTSEASMEKRKKEGYF